MTLTMIAALAALLAGVPAAVFLANLRLYRPPPRLRLGAVRPKMSVLIPARNEQENIEGAVRSALASLDVDLEVVVVDDHSTDATRIIVEGLARQDPRVRLVRSPGLPAGWIGKMHACAAAGRAARHPLLVFIDADVRLAPNALGRMASFLDESGAHLASGIPRQEMETFGERLIIPLIHFVLLGFLPIWRLRRYLSPKYGTGTGQLVVVRRDAYVKVGGHAAIHDSRHDGIHLPRAFRASGYHTDLFDATDVATCRMYHSSRETWQGFQKNADQGLGSKRLIVPITLTLLGGQVLPFLLLSVWPQLPPAALALSVFALVAALLPRLVAVARFRQPLGSALLHPLGVLTLLGNQWLAVVARALGRPATWKGRSYPATTSSPAPAAPGACVEGAC